jgi:dihydroorotate dehydrogenase electron transfer subunit
VTSPAHPAYCADHARVEVVTIEENVQLARDTFRVRFHAPAIAQRIVPGQFIMLRLAGSDDPLLARPLALYDTVLDAGQQPLGLDIVYLVVGKLTSRLARLKPGAGLSVWGPLGNGFPPAPAEHLLMVAGGIGQTPFLSLAREYLGLRQFGAPPREVPRARRVTLCYGARTREYLAGVSDFERLGVDVRISTDDGSAGHAGLVTDLVAQTLAESPAARVVCCGPERMMESVAHLCQERGASCRVSLETPMACGIGICFSCVTKVHDAQRGWDYRRTCVEGPVFDAADIVWSA